MNGGAGASSSAGTPAAGASGAPGSGGAAAGGGGASAGAAVAGGAGGAVAGGGGNSGASGSAGMAGAAPTDRCDISLYDAAKPPKQLEITGNLGTHDPMVLEAAGKFYLFATGDNLAAKTSSDLLGWQSAPEPLPSAQRPAWVGQQVPGVSNLWAPDAAFFGGQYHLYYSASTFGSNRSCIGHLKRASLTSGSWADQGSVICSATSDDYNAIDPNVIVDEAGTPWLSFGSFWSGIKMIKLDQSGARDGASLVALASRPSNSGAVEAPFLVRRCGYYYLFVSWDSCCKGVDSTYNTRVGRSASLTEPFVDRDGKPLLQGGGTLVLQGGTRYKGPGHNAVLFTKTGSYNIYHAYDANNNGAPVLRVAELAWDEGGWPVSAGP
ncbi:MAG: hypothetical protein K0R38_5016 [Polyangiaceae bacterium]|nr:hypothetical protein [Polyangiaceae bacterium]